MPLEVDNEIFVVPNLGEMVKLGVKRFKPRGAAVLFHPEIRLLGCPRKLVNG